jgi:hypothetical protein
LKRLGVGVFNGDGSWRRGYSGWEDIFGVVKTSSTEAGVLQSPPAAEKPASISEERRLLPGVDRASVFCAFRGVSGEGIDICRTAKSVAAINSSSLLRGKSKGSSSSTAVARESCCSFEPPELLDGVCWICDSGL